MNVLFLGTGTSHGVPLVACDCGVCRSSDPRDRRSRPSIYLTFDDGLTALVDTSPDLRSQLLAHDIRRLDAILYTHTHADHLFGLDDVRRFNGITKQAIPVYGDRTSIDDILRVFAYAFAPDAPRGRGVPDLRLFEIGGPFVLGRQDVVPVPVLHGQRRILGLRFGRFAYLTDCNAIPEASLPLVAGLDVLVLDALRRRPHPTHFTVEQAVVMAKRIGARQTYFTHMCHDLGHAETCATLPPGITLAYDGLSIDC